MTGARVALAAAVLVQLAVLYWPSAPGAAEAQPGLDKVVHAAVFAAVAVTGRRAGVPVGVLVAALVVHAGVSEVLQEWVLPDRSGDVADAVADVAGAVLGLVLGRWPAGPVGRRGATPPPREDGAVSDGAKGPGWPPA